VSSLTHEFALGAVSDLYRNVLVVRFRGRPAGAADARYLEAHVALGVTLFVPDALVLDLSQLELASGQVLKGTIRPVEPNLEEGFPLYVVAAGPSRAAAAEALPEEAVVGSVEEALERVRTSGPWALR
jgi:hypothetical protein